ncbi:MAG: DUF5777 family beta-barrel protein [Saprospiraceae bacterium]|nr:DUF5777 family beta-barrel protein [Saprospiraceae bacterium]
MKITITIIIALGLQMSALDAQDLVVSRTFKDTRVINSHSVETLQRGRLDVRITHRFGDIAGDAGGWQTLYGLENAADVLIGAEYGFTDNFTAGIFRTKGAGPLKQLVSGVFKQAILNQREDDRVPISMTLVGIATASTSRNSESPTSLNNFGVIAHRFVYYGQLLIAKKFSPGLSLQVGGGYTHRNQVPFEDINGLFNLSFASRIQLSKFYGIILDANWPLSDTRSTDEGFYPALGIGVEIETGGHVFQLNLTNARGIMATDYMPYTTANWLDGQFRLGFTISRLFNL